MKLRITRKTKMLDQSIFFSLMDDYIHQSQIGKRRQKNGTKISTGTIKNYINLNHLLNRFSEQTHFELKLYIYDNLTPKEKDSAFKYYKNLHNQFMDYMYKMNYIDNYVGFNIKSLKSFYNYLLNECNIPIGTFHKSFYVPKEEIQITTLSVQQLHFLIYDTKFENKLDENLKKIKDIFVFGCTVALRISDLLSLTQKNLIVYDNKYYLKVKSHKTNTYTTIKLPDYAVAIVIKHQSKQHQTLFPPLSRERFNVHLKRLAKLLPDDHEVVKIREQRGKQIIIYKNPVKKIPYKFSDLISSHIMRRTAITTMLNLGMSEHLVKKISGHSANSKEFYRYVEYSQHFLDDQTDIVFGKIKALSMK